jgi:hypothetical protein
MSWVPTFKLYASNGSTLVYTFEHIVPPIIGWPSDNPSSIEHTNIRAAGSIIVPEGNKAYDIVLTGYLLAADYTTLTTKIFSLRDTIVANTRYVLTIDKSISTYDTLKVMRIIPISFEDSNRVRTQKYSITFRVLSWA